MTQQPLHIGIIGSSGRMGQAVQCEISNNPVYSLSEKLENGDVLIDFSNPKATLGSVNLAQKNAQPLVIGTTGLGDVEFKALLKAADTIPILHSNNMSFGMAVFKNLARETALKLGKNISIEIIETHHIHKKDSPSGTALTLKAALPNPENIKITSFREGEIFGEHIVRLSSQGEVVELKHKAGGREIFAQGALKAALWLQNQPPGLYTLDDMLELA